MYMSSRTKSFVSLSMRIRGPYTDAFIPKCNHHWFLGMARTSAEENQKLRFARGAMAKKTRQVPKKSVQLSYRWLERGTELVLSKFIFCKVFYFCNGSPKTVKGTKRRIGASISTTVRTELDWYPSFMHPKENVNDIMSWWEATKSWACKRL